LAVLGVTRARRGRRRGRGGRGDEQPASRLVFLALQIPSPTAVACSYSRRASAPRTRFCLPLPLPPPWSPRPPGIASCIPYPSHIICYRGCTTIDPGWDPTEFSESLRRYARSPRVLRICSPSPPLSFPFLPLLCSPFVDTSAAYPRGGHSRGICRYDYPATSLPRRGFAQNRCLRHDRRVNLASPVIENTQVNRRIRKRRNYDKDARGMPRKRDRRQRGQEAGVKWRRDTARPRINSPSLSLSLSLSPDGRDDQTVGIKWTSTSKTS